MEIAMIILVIGIVFMINQPTVDIGRLKKEFKKIIIDLEKVSKQYKQLEKENEELKLKISEYESKGK